VEASTAQDATHTLAAARATPLSITRPHRGPPIRPVEQTSTSAIWQPSSAATIATGLLGEASPAGPVQASHAPKLSTTARARPFRDVPRGHLDQRGLDLVAVWTVAAAIMQSVATSARSGRSPSAPAVMPAARVCR
jgi:hypothetical protein